MQITLNIDATQLKEEAAATLKSMTEEQKKELVKEAIKTYLSTPLGQSRADWAPIASADFRKERGSNTVRGPTGHWKDVNELSDDDLMKSQEFKEWYGKDENLKKYSLQSLLIQNLIPAVVTEAKAQIQDFIKSDSSVQAVIKSVVDEAKTAMPQFIQAALTLHFTQQIGEMFNQAARAQADANTSLNAVQQMKNALGQRGIY